MSTPDLLFNYLRDILYTPERAALDLSVLPPEFQKLGEGMQFLADCLKENRAFTHAIATGDLSIDPPRLDNALAAPLKELQGTLRHLTWQTQQVAKGDYSQRVDFKGEFSDAFNTMIGQLQSRSEELVRKKAAVDKINAQLTQGLDLILALTNHTRNMIFVHAEESGQQVFANQPARWFQKAAPEAAEVLARQLVNRGRDSFHGSSTWTVELESTSGPIYYSAESFHVVWKDEYMVAHILTDDTERRKREDLHFHLAYEDPLTGLMNRRFAMDQMAQWMEQGISFVFSFVDVDYLKYCNDTFGHETGDRYLIDVAHSLQSLGGTLCRAGGDEFFLLREETTPERQDGRLHALRELLRTREDILYPCSFSYASILVPAKPEMPLKDYMKLADKQMYQFKQANKSPLGDAAYQDGRAGRR